MSEWIPYAELTFEQKALVDSGSWYGRKNAAEGGWGLDKLVNDADPIVREAVAQRGYGLDKLINDSDSYVQFAVVIYLAENNLTLKEWIAANPDKCALPGNRQDCYESLSYSELNDLQSQFDMLIENNGLKISEDDLPAAFAEYCQSPSEFIANHCSIDYCIEPTAQEEPVFTYVLDREDIARLLTDYDYAPTKENIDAVANCKVLEDTACWISEHVGQWIIQDGVDCRGLELKTTSELTAELDQIVEDAIASAKAASAAQEPPAKSEAKEQVR